MQALYHAYGSLNAEKAEATELSREPGDKKKTLLSSANSANSALNPHFSYISASIQHLIHQ
jgi:CRISPR/Cas system type I-B associated protein Csh2 (Cas7 group RAMP superfamily)